MAESNMTDIHQEIDLDDLSETFEHATKVVVQLASSLNSEQLLKLYGLYKQAKQGPCDIPRPSWYQLDARSKWDAWKSLGDKSCEEAMAGYVEAVDEICPSWRDESQDDSSRDRGWVSVSRPVNDLEEAMQDSDKTLFDWIKDSDLSNVVKLLKANPELVNLSDENGMQPMHWAADRGFTSAIESLVEHGADVNAKDADGQTALHYATSCGHLEAIKYLLSVGAKILPDNDGLTPINLADEQLSVVFESHT